MEKEDSADVLSEKSEKFVSVVYVLIVELTYFLSTDRERRLVNQEVVERNISNKCVLTRKTYHLNMSRE